MPTPQTKGLQFRSFLRALHDLRGADAVKATLDALRPELADSLRLGTLVTSGWYPVSWYCELHAGARRALNEGKDLARAVSRAGIQNDFRGVYRLVTYALSPESIFKWAPKIIGLYYDTGTCVVEVAENHFARAKLCGFEGFDENLWEDVIGGTTGIMELAGAKEIAPRPVSGGKNGDADMMLEVTWVT